MIISNGPETEHLKILVKKKFIWSQMRNISLNSQDTKTLSFDVNLF